MLNKSGVQAGHASEFATITAVVGYGKEAEGHVEYREGSLCQSGSPVTSQCAPVYAYPQRGRATKQPPDMTAKYLQNLTIPKPPATTVPV